VVVIAFLLGLLVPVEIVAATNSQVAGRVSPRLVDLLAAIATGLVGAFALIRSDVSDTLPGVAIAISLVPPLAVVGLTLESGAPEEAVGALLLFGTNVAAIVATGTGLMLVARVRQVAREAAQPVARLSGRSIAVIGIALVIVAVPLAVGSSKVARDQGILAEAEPIASDWAKEQGWDVTQIFVRRGVVHVVAVGAPPEADARALRAAFDDAGMSEVTLDVTLMLGGRRRLEGSG
jgi:uncharacterized membrane protein